MKNISRGELLQKTRRPTARPGQTFGKGTKREDPNGRDAKHKGRRYG